MLVYEKLHVTVGKLTGPKMVRELLEIVVIGQASTQTRLLHRQNFYRTEMEHHWVVTNPDANYLLKHKNTSECINFQKQPHPNKPTTSSLSDLGLDQQRTTERSLALQTLEYAEEAMTFCLGLWQTQIPHQMYLQNSSTSCDIK